MAVPGLSGGTPFKEYRIYTVSIGWLQPHGWLALFRVFRLGGQALRAAQALSGCVDARIFRKGKWYFAF
ncbi:MAG: hypothetical protein H7245_05795 [Candidatus Saccharibacteria bacterium]|nr:hypothetical protein [Pseudorhodobacter sp.]